MFLMCGMFFAHLFEFKKLDDSSVPQTHTSKKPLVISSPTHPVDLSKDQLSYPNISFFNSLKAFPQSELKFNNRRAHSNLLLPQGFPLESYALKISEIFKGIEPKGLIEGQISYGNQEKIRLFFFENSKSYSLGLSYNEKYHPEAFDLALGLWLSRDLSSEEITLLKSSNLDHLTLLVDGRKLSTESQKALNENWNGELWLWLPLEPHQYPYQNPGDNAIYIHNSPEEMEQTLQNLLNPYPKAQGLITHMGDRVVENERVLRDLFSLLAGEDLAFFDMTGSQRSLAPKLGRQQGLVVHKGIQPTIPENLDQEWTQLLTRAQKFGSALLLLPFDKNIIDQLKSFCKATEQSKKGFHFVTYTQSGKRKISWPN